MRAVFLKQLFLFLLRRGSGLGGLSFGHALLEFIHATCGIDEFLCAGVKRMAGIADADDHGRFDRASLDDIATGAANFRLQIFRMSINFHNKEART